MPILIYTRGNLSNAINLVKIMQETQPDEVFSLVAQSYGAVSFKRPKYAKVVAADPARTMQHSLLKINGLGVNFSLE